MERRNSRLGRDLLTIGLGSAAFFSIALGARDLWNPNEPIYGRAVVEMWQRGDWLIPTVNDGAFAEKPILYYWMALCFSKLLGSVSELSLRLPSVVAGVCTALLTYLLVLPYAGRKRACLATLMLVTQYSVWWSSRTVQMDVLILASTIAVLVPLTRMLDFDLSPTRAWLFTGVAAGLGFLAKGPVAWVLPGLTFLGLVAHRRSHPARWARGLVGGAVTAVLIAAPWFAVLYANGHGDLVHEVLLRQNFSRFVEAWDHDQSWHYYLPYMFSDYLPWSLFVPIAIGLRLSSSQEQKLNTLAWIWLVTTVVFFSLADSKRAPYISSIAPAIAILASDVLLRLADGRLSRPRRRACLVLTGFLATLLALVAGILIMEPARFHPDLVTASTIAGGVAAASSVALFVGLWWFRRYPSRLPLTIAAAVATLFLSAAVFVLPAVDVIKSARPWARELEKFVGPDDKLISFGFYRWRAGYPFYAERSITNYLSLTELAEVWRQEDLYLLVEDNAVGDVRKQLGEIELVMEHHFASRVAYLFSNREARQP